MKSKQILHDLIVAFKANNIEKASLGFKHYLNQKINEMSDDYDSDGDYDSYEGYNDSDRFDEVEDVKDKAQLTVAGHKVDLTFSAKQQVATHGESDTRDTPGWNEVYEYGPIFDIGQFNSFRVDGVVIDSEFEMLIDATAESLKTKSGVEEYHDDILEIVRNTEYPVPTEIKSLFTPEFAKAIVFAFGKYLESKEGIA